MIYKTHTRNQRRMYRIHKQEEQIEKDKYIIGEQQITIDKYKKVIDKIKEWVYHQQQSNENLEPYISTDKLDEILELLEEIK